MPSFEYSTTYAVASLTDVHSTPITPLPLLYALIIDETANGREYVYSTEELVFTFSSFSLVATTTNEYTPEALGVNSSVPSVASFTIFLSVLFPFSSVIVTVILSAPSSPVTPTYFTVIFPSLTDISLITGSATSAQSFLCVVAPAAVSFTSTFVILVPPFVSLAVICCTPDGISFQICSSTLASAKSFDTPLSVTPPVLPLPAPLADIVTVAL